MRALRSLSAILAVSALGLTAAAPAQGDPLYVALGDSYQSGPLVLLPHGTPIDCGRSTVNPAGLVARGLGYRLRDVTCGSATTKHMTQPQTGLPLGGTNPPQFNALTPDASLVTVGIGGNDAGLVGVATTCAEMGIDKPRGRTCREHYTAGGEDRVAARIASAAPKVAAVLRGIQDRAPNARIALFGYPAAVPTDGSGCWPGVPMSPDDLAYVGELLLRINAMMAEQAAATGAEFLDIYTDSVGHDVCKLPPTRWFEGLVPTEPAFPLHPNARGLAGAAASALEVLRRPPPARRTAITAMRVARPARPVGAPAVVAFRADRSVPVTFRLERSRAGRYVHVRAFAGTAVAGENRVRLTRQMLGRRPGAFRLTVTPADAGSGAALRLRMSAR